jgi:hypothetical protein
MEAPHMCTWKATITVLTLGLGGTLLLGQTPPSNWQTTDPNAHLIGMWSDVRILKPDTGTWTLGLEATR